MQAFDFMLAELVEIGRRLEAAVQLSPDQRARLRNVLSFLEVARTRIGAAEAERQVPRPVEGRAAEIAERLNDIVVRTEDVVPAGLADVAAVDRVLSALSQGQQLARDYASTLPGDPIDLPD